jgi:hypothetical protein
MSAKVVKTNPSNRQLVQRQQYRILDESARNHRNRSQLEQLERDNFDDDPHANLVMHKKAPKFENNTKALNNGSGSSLKRHQLPRSRMLTLSSLIEEDSKTDEPNYSSAVTRSPINSSDTKTPFIYTKASIVAFITVLSIALRLIGTLDVSNGPLNCLP